MAKKKSKREFVVGYVNSDIVYGGGAFRDHLAVNNWYTGRVSLWRANQIARHLKSFDSKASIFRLVPVETRTVAEWRKPKKGAKK